MIKKTFSSFAILLGLSVGVQAHHFDPTDYPPGTVEPSYTLCNDWEGACPDLQSIADAVAPNCTLTVTSVWEEMIPGPAPFGHLHAYYDHMLHGIATGECLYHTTPQTINVGCSRVCYPTCGDGQLVGGDIDTCDAPPPPVEPSDPYIEVCALRDGGTSVMLDEEWMQYGVGFNLTRFKEIAFQYNLADTFPVPIADGEDSPGCKRFTPEVSEAFLENGALFATRLVSIPADSPPEELVRDIRIRVQYVDEMNSEETRVLSSQAAILTYTSVSNEPWASIMHTAIVDDFTVFSDIYAAPEVLSQRWILVAPGGGVVDFLSELEDLEEL